MFEPVENEPSISPEHAHGRLIRAGLVISQSSGLGNIFSRSSNLGELRSWRKDWFRRIAFFW